MAFDPDALLAALPVRPIRSVAGVRCRRATVKVQPQSAFGQSGEYNGFSLTERNRTARLSNRLAQLGATVRPQACQICDGAAHDEHAENYFDLSKWVGLCKSCHRGALHNRFTRPSNWTALLDRHALAEGHWARLVSPVPFDLAKLLRERGIQEPTMSDFVAS